MTVIEAAVILRLTPRRVRQFIAQGCLVATKPGRDYWIEQDALEAFQARQRRSGRVKR